ncbi:MAG: serine hydrolase [Ignavibacteriaceae bacterium]|nr:serine hydrolase [Ignavibacteriaceae bacterium]
MYVFSKNTLLLWINSKFGLILLILFFISFNNVNSYSQSLSKTLNNYINTYKKNKDVPSISCGAIKDGKIIWLGTSGYSDLENRITANSKTLYRIASISKCITAVAIIQLASQNKIKLDDDALKYLPDFPEKKWKFSIRQLLNHTAGIREYKDRSEFHSKEHFTSINEVLKYLEKDSLVYEPGTKYHYSTLGYNFLGAIIENVSGLTYEEYVTRKIFEPAGIKNIKLDYQQLIISNRSRGYSRDNFRKIINAPLADLSIKFPGGGFISNSEDLLLFSNALLTGVFFPKNWIDTLSVSVKLKNGSTQNYGLGFAINKDSKGRFYLSHSGQGTGFTTLLVIYPVEKIATVSLINISDRKLESPALDIADFLLGNEIKYPRKSTADYLFKLSSKISIDSIYNLFKVIKSDSSKTYNSDDDELINLGYDLINTKRTIDAIRLLRSFANENPTSTKTLAALADAYYNDGNEGMALKTYRQIIQLDPNHSYALKMIKKITGN